MTQEPQSPCVDWGGVLEYHPHIVPQQVASSCYADHCRLSATTIAVEVQVRVQAKSPFLLAAPYLLFICQMAKSCYASFPAYTSRHAMHTISLVHYHLWWPAPVQLVATTPWLSPISHVWFGCPNRSQQPATLSTQEIVKLCTPLPTQHPLMFTIPRNRTSQNNPLSVVTLTSDHSLHW